MEYCLYQGTFNPIHRAHLNVAEFALQNYKPDKILFIPSYIPPHKSSDIADSVHRLNLTKITTKYNNKFEVSDIEIRRGGISYTYLTVKELYERILPKKKLKFIIGTDAFKQIETWYEADKLKSLLDFIVFIREDNFNKNSLIPLKIKGYNYEIMPLAFDNLSSTEIRKRIKFGLSVSDLIPKEAEEYIKKYELYKS